MRHAADRLSVRCYTGYDLGESLPDHSSLTRIRNRYGVEVFRRFFEKIVEQCQEAGLVWGKELYIDATKVKANASLDTLTLYLSMIFGLFLEFGDFGIAELFLLNLKYLLEQRHHPGVFAYAHVFPKCENEPLFGE